MNRIKKFLKNILKDNKLIATFACNFFNGLPFNNKIKRKRRNIIIANGFMKKCVILFRGQNNIVEVKPGAVLKKCTFKINGNNNHVVIGKDSYANRAEFYTEDSCNSIVVGDRTNLCGQVHLAAIEGTKIIIGDDCLFSSEIVFRTGDSHNILDANGNRINQSKNIVIGNHVWIGHRALVNKGVEVGADSVIGTGAIVTKSFSDQNVVIAGAPAKVVKIGINWDKERK